MSNQYNIDPNANYGASMPPIGSQPPTQPNQDLGESMPNTSTNQNSNIMRNENENGYNMGQQNTANSYNPAYMNQNQPNNQPGYGQAQMQHNPNNFSQERPAMGGDNPSSQHPVMSPGMMGQTNLSSNQPPIGQRNFQSYQQPSYGGGQPNNQNMSQNLGGMTSSGGMNQNYMQNSQSQMSSMPSVGMNATPGTFNTSQGEKTYEPGALQQNNTSNNLNFVELVGISPESQNEFEEKSARCKGYKQTDIFAAIQVTNEEDGLKIINYLVSNAGVSLTAIDSLEQTALFYAARDGKIQILNMLIEKG